MRILFAIPHYLRTEGDESYRERRADALLACVTALHQLFQPARCTIDHGRRAGRMAPAGTPHEIQVVICTTRGAHVLERLPGVARYVHHHATGAVPEVLGFTCHDVLRGQLGHHDYYCYLEDDLVLHDPQLFVKLAWFNAAVGDESLLQPNRYEAGLGHLVPKVYVDGDLAERVTAPFQDVRDSPPLSLEVFGQRFLFERTLNPHSGCFFLNARQMEHWVRQPHFADRQSRLLGPLETTATLGILRTFKIYKPALAQADFLEIQHHGTGYLAQLCTRSP
jgi:hypothetical protein